MAGEILKFKQSQGVEVSAGSESRNDDPSPSAAAKKPEMDPGTQNHIGRILKESYDDLVRQPVPDRFIEILKELERREKDK